MELARLTRRKFVAAGLVALGGIALPGCGRSKSVGTEDFLALSRVLTGEKDLPAAHAAAYLELLDDAGLEMSASELVRAAGRPADLSALKVSTLRSDKARKCAQAITAAWWSGIAPVADGGQVVVTYTDALVWRVMPFAHPPSTCLGETGVWARPPAKLAA